MASLLVDLSSLTGRSLQYASHLASCSSNVHPRAVQPFSKVLLSRAVCLALNHYAGVDGVQFVWAGTKTPRRHMRAQHGTACVDSRWLGAHWAAQQASGSASAREGCAWIPPNLPSSSLFASPTAEARDVIARWCSASHATGSDHRRVIFSSDPLLRPLVSGPATSVAEWHAMVPRDAMTGPSLLLFEGTYTALQLLYGCHPPQLPHLWSLIGFPDCGIRRVGQPSRQRSTSTLARHGCVDDLLRDTPFLTGYGLEQVVQLHSASIADAVAVLTPQPALAPDATFGDSLAAASAREIWREFEETCAQLLHAAVGQSVASLLLASLPQHLACTQEAQAHLSKPPFKSADKNQAHASPRVRSRSSSRLLQPSLQHSGLDSDLSALWALPLRSWYADDNFIPQRTHLSLRKRTQAFHLHLHRGSTQPSLRTEVRRQRNKKKDPPAG